MLLWVSAAHLIGVSGYLTEVLISISHVTGDVEHIFIRLFAIRVYWGGSACSNVLPTLGGCLFYYY